MCDHPTSDGNRCGRLAYCWQHQNQLWRKCRPLLLALAVEVVGGLLLILFLKTSTFVVGLIPTSSSSHTLVASYPSMTFSSPLANLSSIPSGATSNPLSVLNVTGSNISSVSLQESLSHSDAVTALANGATPQTGAQLLSNFVVGNGPMPSVLPPSLSGLEVNGK
jgi:hypothetical protein